MGLDLRTSLAFIFFQVKSIKQIPTKLLTLALDDTKLWSNISCLTFEIQNPYNIWLKLYILIYFIIICLTGPGPQQVTAGDHYPTFNFFTVRSDDGRSRLEVRFVPSSGLIFNSHFKMPRSISLSLKFFLLNKWAQ